MVRRWVAALVLGGVWWWAVLRLVLEPAHAGLVEGAVAAGGWGLSLLPVHVAATAGQAGASGVDGDAGAGRWSALALRCAGRWSAPGVRCAGWWAGVGMRWLERWFAFGMLCVSRWSAVLKPYVGRVRATTRAWIRRRSGGGSGRS